MRSVFYSLIIVCMSITFLSAESYLMRYADVSADNIVFTYESDLWLVPVTGGMAKRITRSDGSEIYAKFSPDGSKLAFTANYDGGSDVYVMDVNGGVPVRLTFHPGQDLVVDWFPDGKYILFRSRREWPYRADKLYKVSVEGGYPEKLPVDRAGLASISPDEKMIAYNRLSRELRHWKRYKGGWAQDIWVGNFADKDYRPITKFEGTDDFPMWSGDYIYFTSDRKDGTLNLYKINPVTKEINRLTMYNDYDIKWPSIGPHHIIFQYAAELYLFDLKNETAPPKKVNIEIPTDETLMRADYIDASKYTGAFGLSPSGKRALIEMRGEIISFPADEGIVYNLTQTSGSREKNPAWSPDGKKIAFLSDKNGEEEIYLIDPSGGKWKQLTKGNPGFKMQPVWSPDSKYLIYHDKYMKLNLVDASTGKSIVIDQGEFDDAWERWGIQDYSWSPDSRWVCYSKMETNMNESIFIYSIQNNKKYRITSNMTQDWSPSFSKNGKYLYFLSNRTYEPVMGFVDQNHIFLDMAKPYVILLKAGDTSPFAPENEKENSEKSSEENRTDNVEISPLTDFESRMVAAPVKAANLFRLEAIDGGFLFLKKTENEFLKYQVVTDENSGTNLDLYRFDIKSGKDRMLMSGISQYHLSADGSKIIYKSRNTFGIADAVGEARVGDGSINLNDAKIKINKHEEYMQIFNEAWRIERDWFYDPNMHGVNWTKVGEMYRKFVPYCGSRGDLTYLIGEMIAELSIGHTYVYGGDNIDPERISTGLLGAEFAYDSPSSYPKIKRIIPGHPWDPSAQSPLAQPGCPVKVGDYILAIDGVNIHPGENIYKYLQTKSGKAVEIAYSSSPDPASAKLYLTESLRSEYSLRYNEWAEANRQYVWQKTNDMVGYIQLPGMMQNGLAEFAKGYYSQHEKKGLIIDVRYNGGGFTSKQIIDRLERVLNTMVQPREGKPGRVPERTFYGHMVLLINHDTGSDGEIFSETWKARSMGPVIGTRTWGGAVGIEPHQNLIDGGTVTPPQFGEYNLKGQWIIEGRGVEPDIIVINWPKDVLAGKDDQLDKAIQIILENIKNEPMPLPEQPPYPDKSKPALK
jgi:tricorn protease